MTKLFLRMLLLFAQTKERAGNNKRGHNTAVTTRQWETLLYSMEQHARAYSCNPEEPKQADMGVAEKRRWYYVYIGLGSPFSCIEWKVAETGRKNRRMSRYCRCEDGSRIPCSRGAGVAAFG